MNSLGGVRAALIDLAVLPFAEQLRVVADTDLLVGAHGAGLAHVLCMPPGGAIVEVVPEPVGSTPLMYANLAAFRGIRWAPVAARERRGLRGAFLRPDPARVRAVAAEIRTLLGIPSHIHIAALIPLGYPLSPFRPTKRKPIGQVLHYDRWRPGD